VIIARTLMTRLNDGDEIARFDLGGRDTRVVRVGAFPRSEFVALWCDTGAIIGIPELTLERAAERARVAAMPEEEEEEDACCPGGCSRCTTQQGWIF
jgi:hypothetical protein